MAEGVLEVPCLGRTFSLGMLYDCRSDTLIPGKTLWGQEQLQNKCDIKSICKSHFEVKTGDSFSEKVRLLEVEGETKLSILAGLIKVSGSAQYLIDKVQSSSQARVSLRFQLTTSCEQLTMDQLGKQHIEYTECLDSDIGTHVVTAVEWGANAIFVFDIEGNQNENIEKLQDSMKTEITNIPSLEINEHSVTKMKDKEIANHPALRCKLYSDVVINDNPLTYLEAVRIYKSLPDKIKGNKQQNGVYGVPLKAYLLPLADLGCKKERIFRTIKINVVQETNKLYEQYDELDIKCSDIENEYKDLVELFSGLRQLFMKFKSNSANLRGQFQELLKDAIVKARVRQTDETLLSKLLLKWRESPCSPDKLDHWLDNRKRELVVLRSYIQDAKKHSLQVLSKPGDLEAVFSSTNSRYLLCLIISKLTSDKQNSFVNEMKDYDMSDDANEEDSWQDDSWTDNENMIQYLRRKLHDFALFKQANVELSECQYVIYSSNDRIDVTIEPGTLLLYTEGKRRKKYFDIPRPPLELKVKEVTECSITVEWTASDCKELCGYLIKYQCKQSIDGSIKTLDLASNDCNEFCIENLESDAVYEISIATKTEIGRSNFLTTTLKTKPQPPLACELKPYCTNLEGPPTYTHQWLQVPIEVTRELDNGIRHVSVGFLPSIQSGYKETKVLLILGATGSGKTTLINGIINYYYGVRIEDDFRLLLINDETSQSQAHSQTSNITAYHIAFHPKSQIPFNLIVIDTPGYGDTRGIEQDRYITSQIKRFFDKDGSINHLSAVAFVVPASEARLTPTQRYIFTAILEIFGKDISSNIVVMATFADAHDVQVLGALKEFKVPFEHCFKFNNCVFNKAKRASVTVTENQELFYRMYWIMAYESFKNFFNFFQRMEAKSLTLTRQVLDERKQLEAVIEGLQGNIQFSLTKLSQMKSELDFLVTYEAERTANKNYKRKVIVPKVRKVDTPVGQFLTNCLVCNRTCHEVCGIAKDEEKYYCVAMTVDKGTASARCGVCSKKCGWKEHKNTPFKFVHYEEEEEISIEDLQKKYNAAERNLSKVENILIGLVMEYNKVQQNSLTLAIQLRQHVNRLDQIALRSRGFTDVEYLDMLIEEQKLERAFHWEMRVAELTKLRDRAKILKGCEGLGPAREEFQPLAHILDMVKHKGEKKSVITTCKSFIEGQYNKFMSRFSNSK